MNKKVALQDFRKNRVINLSILLFVCITAALVSAAFILGTSLFSSIDHLMFKAKAPDFLQMHQGDVDFDKLDEFAQNNPYVKEYQCLDFVNMEGEQIVIYGQSQEGSVQDNGIVWQSEKFDYLLDLENEIIRVDPGEIYLPLMFYEDGTAKVGDTVEIAGKEFLLKGFFRDSQMNSNMAGSKRFLLNRHDFEEIRDEGHSEYLIEFLLHDRAQTSEFEKTVEEELPYKNGVSVTYSMFKMINALNDGMMIAVLVLASVLVILIAMLCIRFTLTAKLEEEFREIAVMKAIGIEHKEIKRIYLTIYLLLAGIGCVLGYFLALFFQSKLLEGISLYMGKSESAHLTPYLALLGPVLIFLFLAIYLSRKLEEVKKIKPVSALRDGESGLSAKKKEQSSLKRINLSRPLAALAARDVSAKRGLYLTILKLITLAVFLILLPLHIYNTINHESFMNSLGMGLTDLSIDIQQVDEIEEKTADLLSALRADASVEKAESFITRNQESILPGGQSAYLKISTGDHLSFPIEYSEGRAPDKEGEIALSTLYMDDLELNTGDVISLADDGRKMTVVGIYSDISNGGKTAKSVGELPAPILKTNVFVKLKEGSDVESFSVDYAKHFSYAKILSVREHADQAFGSLRGRLKSASLLSFIASAAVIALVSSLFTKLLLAKEKKSLASLKALGFSSLDLQKKQLLSLLFVSILSIALGILLANFLGGYIAGALLSSFGASSIKLRIHPVLTYIALPLAILALALVTAFIVSREIHGIQISESIKE